MFISIASYAFGKNSYTDKSALGTDESAPCDEIQHRAILLRVGITV